jgi:hypothetical protein
MKGFGETFINLGHVLFILFLIFNYFINFKVTYLLQIKYCPPPAPRPTKKGKLLAKPKPAVLA